MNICRFSELPKINNTLYVFDIDDTTLYYNFKLDDHSSQVIEKFEANTQIQTPEFQKANTALEEAFRTHTPIVHDRTGLEELKRFCDTSGGKIIFLTARFKTIEELTVFHMQLLYPWVTTKHVYLCNGTEKGVMLFNIVTNTDYHSIVFVDDKDYNINSVRKFVPSVNLYKMTITDKPQSVV